MNVTRSIVKIWNKIGYWNSKQSSLRLPSFQHFPFHPTIYKYLEASDIHTPSYCQYAFYSALTRTDQKMFHLTAPTGSGKTLSYLLPIASQLKYEQDGNGSLTASQRPRALVLTATKELVFQCRNVGKQISHHCKLKIQGLGIGRSLFDEKQSVIKGVDILVANHTRLSAQMQNKTVFLSNLKWLIIDETDTIFQTGKLQTVIRKIIDRTKNMQNPPKILFSGTTSPSDLKQMLKRQFKDYTQITDKNTHMNLQNIKHQFMQCQDLDKHQTLLDVLYQRRDVKTLIFCNTVKSLHELMYFLEENGIKTLSLHSQLHKNARLQNYSLFRDGQSGVLISTDLGARGLDFPHLQRVVNYDFPTSTVDYLQRAGRTGRAGRSGQVVTLYHKKNHKIINQLKDASFSSKLKISNSAYRIPNKQIKRPTKASTQL